MFDKKFFLIIFMMVTTFGVASVVSEELRSNTTDLGTAEDLIRECKEENNCEKIILALTKAKRSLKSYDFDGIELIGVDLGNANLSNANLSNGDLRIAYLEDASLSNTDLTNANLHSAYLGSASLINTNLTGANLGNTHVRSANLEGANLKNAYLVNADLDTADLRNVNLSYADLTNANLNFAKFSDTNFEYANLNGVDLTNTNSSGANLDGANLTNAILVKSPGTVYQIDIDRVKSACNWQQAIYKANLEKGNWIIDEPANQQYIEQLKQDKASEPKKAVDCSRWE